MHSNNLGWLLDIIVIVALLSLVSCSSNKTPPPVAYKPGGIVIKYSATKNLNEYDGSAHSLMLIVYQLDNINGFLQLGNNIAGTQKLLTLAKFDNSVTGVNNLFVYAGESGQFKLDRLENTKWIGIVAGYYNINPIQAVKEFQIPSNLNHNLNLTLFFDSNAVQEVKK